MKPALCSLLTTKPSRYSCHTETSSSGGPRVDGYSPGNSIWIETFVESIFKCDCFLLSGFSGRDFDGKHLKVRSPSLVTHRTRTCVISWPRTTRCVGREQESSMIHFFSRVSFVPSSFVLSHRGFPWRSVFYKNLKWTVELLSGPEPGHSPEGLRGENLNVWGSGLFS